MPTATKFEAEDVGNGFPFCLPKVDVSDRGDGDPYDYWITLGGFKKGDAGSPTAQQISDSLRAATKLFWNYNGHTAEFNSTVTVSIDIEQGEFAFGTEDSPFAPRDRVCVGTGAFDPKGWRFSAEEDSGPVFADTDIRIYPIRMYDGDPDSEDNFLGYGLDFAFGEPFAAKDVNGAFRFYFSSLTDNIEPTEPWTFEYSDALEGIWFVASAEANSGATSIDGLEATFEGTTITYKDFDFWTYPA